MLLFCSWSSLYLIYVPIVGGKIIGQLTLILYTYTLSIGQFRFKLCLFHACKNIYAQQLEQTVSHPVSGNLHRLEVSIQHDWTEKYPKYSSTVSVRPEDKPSVISPTFKQTTPVETNASRYPKDLIQVPTKPSTLYCNAVPRILKELSIGPSFIPRYLKPLRHFLVSR